MFRLNRATTKAPAMFAIAGCAPDTHDSYAKMLKELDDQWSKTAGARDLDGTVAFYADDAVVMPGDASTANTKQAIREVWAPMLGPTSSVSWQANQTEVARSGDVGYARGVYKLVMKDAAGKDATDVGKFLEIWKKQSDGKWKCSVDSFSSDAPPPPALPEKKK